MKYPNDPGSLPFPLVPPARHAQVFLNFDGTIARPDVFTGLFERFARDDSWRSWQQMYQADAIGAREFVTKAFSLVQADDAMLDEFLGSVVVDPGLVPLLQFLASVAVPVSILSDGIDVMIKDVLARVKVPRVVVRANGMRRTDGRIELLCLSGERGCRSTHCKCESMQVLSGRNRRSIYVGDGYGDQCAARSCPCVFAKGTLARYLVEDRKGFYPFESLADVQRVLEAEWALTTENPVRGGRTPREFVR